jgi:DnaJ-class molecular chaperone
VEYKDYYRVLGVPRDASDDEVRQAFRRLARRYHPDVAREPRTAEEKFKEINEAYEVLGDPKKRAQYDALGPNWRPGPEFRRPPGSTRRPGQAHQPGGRAGFEFQFGGTGFSDFFEQLFGSMAGRRGRPGFPTEETAEFAERGHDVEADLLVTLDEAFGGATRPISLRTQAPCAACRGSGLRRDGRPCPTCQGAGRTTQTAHYQVRIPPGVREGQRLRLAGRGEASDAGGPAGDLFLRVRLARHPDFRVEGDNLYHELALAPWEAVLGAEVSVPTLTGRVNIRIPPGSQSGQRLRLRNQGLTTPTGARGDLLVGLQIQVPARVNPREQALWEQLARESRFHPRE